MAAVDQPAAVVRRSAANGLVCSARRLNLPASRPSSPSIINSAAQIKPTARDNACRFCTVLLKQRALPGSNEDFSLRLLQSSLCSRGSPPIDLAPGLFSLLRTVRTAYYSLRRLEHCMSGYCCKHRSGLSAWTASPKWANGNTSYRLKHLECPALLLRALTAEQWPGPTTHSC